MPELPEVETVVRGLRPLLVGRTIVSVEERAPRSLIAISPSLKGTLTNLVSGRCPHLPIDVAHVDMCHTQVVSTSFRASRLTTLLSGQKVLDISRRGKNILMRLSGEMTLWVHLKMTGKFRHVESDAPVGRHDLVLFNLDSPDSRQLRFNDYRRFGRLRLYPDHELWQQPGLVNLGPEPLEMSAPQFVQLCHAHTRMIKPALLDQSFIAGLGNIYADESLWASKIHPRRLTSSISGRKLLELHGHIQRLLHKAIRMMGTTVDSYAGVNGQTGRFQKYLQVYGRDGAPCHRCSSKLVREKIGSRSAHYCPRCQRKF